MGWRRRGGGKVFRALQKLSENRNYPCPLEKHWAPQRKKSLAPELYSWFVCTHSEENYGTRKMLLYFFFFLIIIIIVLINLFCTNVLKAYSSYFELHCHGNLIVITLQTSKKLPYLM